MGPLGRAKFHANRSLGWERGPQNGKNFHIFGKESPCKGEPFDRFLQEAQLMLTTGAMRLVVSRGQQTWYHFGSVATFRTKHVTGSMRHRRGRRGVVNNSMQFPPK